MFKTIFILSLIMLIAPVIHAKEISFSQEDRERLIRLETKVEEGIKATNQRMEEGFKNISQRLEEGLKTTNQRIDDLRDLVYIVIGGIIGLIGFVLWDRRTALAPAIRKNKELEEREELIERALKEFARQEPRLLEILKSLRIM